MEPSPRRPLPKRRGAPSPAKTHTSDALSNKKHDHKISPASFHKTSQQGWICPIEKHLSNHQQRVGEAAGQAKRLSSNQRRFMKALEQKRDSMPAAKGALLVDNFNEVAAAVAAVLDSADEERVLNLSASGATDMGRVAHVAGQDRSHARHSRAATEAAVLAAEAEAAKAKAVAAVAVAQQRLQLAKAVAVRNGVRARKLKARQVAQRRKYRKGAQSWKPGGASTKWTRKEDEALRQIMTLTLQEGPNVKAVDWKRVSSQLHRYGSFRADAECQNRWEKILRPGLVKGPWTPAEDKIVIDYVARRGVRNVKWSEIANVIDGRIGKQCRERWFNHLDPTLNKGRWTPEEDDILFTAQERVGNKWSKIAELLPGRAENDVKNRFNSSAKRKWKVLQMQITPNGIFSHTNSVLSAAPFKSRGRPTSAHEMSIAHRGRATGSLGMGVEAPRQGTNGGERMVFDDRMHGTKALQNNPERLGKIAPYMWMQIYAANAYMAAAAAVATRLKERSVIPGSQAHRVLYGAIEGAPSLAATTPCEAMPRGGEYRGRGMSQRVGGGHGVKQSRQNQTEMFLRTTKQMPILPFPASFPIPTFSCAGSSTEIAAKSTTVAKADFTLHSSSRAKPADRSGVPLFLRASADERIQYTSLACNTLERNHARVKPTTTHSRCCSGEVDLDEEAIELAMELPSPGSALSSGFGRIASPNAMSTVSPCALLGARKPSAVASFGDGGLVLSSSVGSHGDIGAQMCMPFEDAGRNDINDIGSIPTAHNDIDALFQLDRGADTGERGNSTLFPGARIPDNVSSDTNLIGNNITIESDELKEMVENLPRPLMMMSIDDTVDGAAATDFALGL